MQAHGTAEAALAALPALARASGASDYAIYPLDRVYAELAAGEKIGARLICAGMSEYPAALSELPDAPPMFWAMGVLDVLGRPTVAMVGARNASSLGIRMAKKLAADLGDAGITIVSGMARGVDTAAHLGAMANGSVAVQDGGVDVIYPAENAKLAHDITSTGVRLSEMPMGQQPQARHFPTRNRIISGLAQAVVVIEAAAKSGSLITARNALDQGREVLAVPGHPFDARAWGCNMLIRDGAALVRGADDVLEVLRATPCDQPAQGLPLTPDRAIRPMQDSAGLHDEILSRLGPSPIAEDQLMRDIHAQAAQIAPALVDLELAGKILRQPGGLLSRLD
jgi:DNA processing protein